MTGIRGDGSSEEGNGIVYPNDMSLERNMCLFFVLF